MGPSAISITVSASVSVSVSVSTVTLGASGLGAGPPPHIRGTLVPLRDLLLLSDIERLRLGKRAGLQTEPVRNSFHAPPPSLRKSKLRWRLARWSRPRSSIAARFGPWLALVEAQSAPCQMAARNSAPLLLALMWAVCAAPWAGAAAPGDWV